MSLMPTTFFNKITIDGVRTMACLNLFKFAIPSTHPIREAVKPVTRELDNAFTHYRTLASSGQWKEELFLCGSPTYEAAHQLRVAVRRFNLSLQFMLNPSRQEEVRQISEGSNPKSLVHSREFIGQSIKWHINDNVSEQARLIRGAVAGAFGRAIVCIDFQELSLEDPRVAGALFGFGRTQLLASIVPQPSEILIDDAARYLASLMKVKRSSLNIRSWQINVSEAQQEVHRRIISLP